MNSSIAQPVSKEAEKTPQETKMAIYGKALVLEERKADTVRKQANLTLTENQSSGNCSRETLHSSESSPALVPGACLSKRNATSHCLYLSLCCEKEEGHSANLRTTWVSSPSWQKSQRSVCNLYLSP
jgi:hypothetical protein